MEKKLKWGKPKLIVLVRGDRAEAVLTGCKYTGNTTNPFDIGGGGSCNDIWVPFCSNCVSISAS
jgi:hypothetical protein